MQNITLPVELVNAILQYMGSRPYGEVFQFVAAIQEQAAQQTTPQATSEPDKPAES
jgi:hypothetical protein